MNLTNLTELNLSSNKLTTIPAEIGKLTKLKVLYLSSNQLATLPGEIISLAPIYGVLLDSNYLPVATMDSKIAAWADKYDSDKSWRTTQKKWPLKIVSIAPQWTMKNSSVKITPSMITFDRGREDETILLSSGSNYTVSGTTKTPAKDFVGILTVPVRAVSGTDTSAAVNMREPLKIAFSNLINRQ